LPPALPRGCGNASDQVNAPSIRCDKGPPPCAAARRRRSEIARDAPGHVEKKHPHAAMTRARDDPPGRQLGIIRSAKIRPAPPVLASGSPRRRSDRTAADPPAPLGQRTGLSRRQIHTRNASLPCFANLASTGRFEHSIAWMGLRIDLDQFDRACISHRSRKEDAGAGERRAD
jgi:hypothetical protein